MFFFLKVRRIAKQALGRQREWLARNPGDHAGDVWRAIGYATSAVRRVAFSFDGEAWLREAARNVRDARRDFDTYREDLTGAGGTVFSEVALELEEAADRHSRG